MRLQFRSLVAAVVMLFASAMAACPKAGAADLIFTIQQVGPNVVMNGSGSVNTTGFGTPGTATMAGAVFGQVGALIVGPTTPTVVDYWFPLVNKPTFGTGSIAQASSGTGDIFGFNSFNTGGLYLPTNYVSGSALSGQSTFAGTTITALGLTPGTYTLTWLAGTTPGSAELTISAVPEPSTYALATMATGVMAAMARRRKAHKA